MLVFDGFPSRKHARDFARLVPRLVGLEALLWEAVDGQSAIGSNGVPIVPPAVAVESPTQGPIFQHLCTVAILYGCSVREE